MHVNIVTCVAASFEGQGTCRASVRPVIVSYTVVKMCIMVYIFGSEFYIRDYFNIVQPLTDMQNGGQASLII